MRARTLSPCADHPPQEGSERRRKPLAPTPPPSRPFWARFGPFWTFFDQFAHLWIGLFWAILGHLGHFAIFVTFGPFWPFLDHFGPFWTAQALGPPSRLFWARFGPFLASSHTSGLGYFGPFWPFWAIWGHFGHFRPFWAILAILGILGHFGHFGPLWAIFAPKIFFLGKK